MVIGLFLHSLIPPPFQYLIPPIISLQLSIPSLGIAGPFRHRICSVFRFLLLWPLICIFHLDVLQTTPFTILETFHVMSFLLVRTFFSFFSFLLLTHWTLCSFRMYSFLVRFPVYPPLMLLLITTGVLGSLMHLDDMMGSLMRSFVVEVYISDLLGFVEAL